MIRVLVIALMASIFLGGCVSRAVKEGVGAFRGASGITVVIDPVSHNNRDVALMEYTQFELDTFTDGFGGKTPARLFARLPIEFSKELSQAKIVNQRSGKKLLIRGEILSYEDSTRAVNQAFGPHEEVVARVQLVDAASGKVIGLANCIGRSTATVNQGVDKKAEGLAGAIVNWIAQHYPKPVEDK